MPLAPRVARLLRSSLPTLLPVSLTFALAGSAGAQSGSSAPLAVQLPAGPVAAAQGGAYATGREQDVLFADPAQLALASARGMSATMFRFGSASTGASVSSATALGGAGGVGVGVQLLEYDGPRDPAPVALRELGRRGALGASSVAVSIGGATVLRDTRFGVALKYAGDTRGGSRGGAGAADLSVAREIGLRRRTTVALVAQNLGHGMEVAGETSPLPRRLSLAVGRQGVEAGPVDLAVEAMASLLHDGSFAPALGGGASYEWLDGYEVTARAGIRRADRFGTETAHATASVGGGITADRLSLDYAFYREAGSNVQTLGIRLH